MPLLGLDYAGGRPGGKAIAAAGYSFVVRYLPQHNYDVLFDAAGGWEGDCAVAFGVQEFGGRTVDDARGFLSLASWITADRSLVPVDPAYTAVEGGRPILRHNPTPAYVAPDGAVGISLNYAAPGGAGLAEGRSV